MIDYLVPDFFINLSPDGSGGMHTKVERVCQAVSSTYRLQVSSDLSEMRSEFLLIEPLYFRMSQVFETENGIADLEALRAHPATKIPLLLRDGSVQMDRTIPQRVVGDLWRCYLQLRLSGIAFRGTQYPEPAPTH